MYNLQTPRISSQKSYLLATTEIWVPDKLADIFAALIERIYHLIIQNSDQASKKLFAGQIVKLDFSRCREIPFVMIAEVKSAFEPSVPSNRSVSPFL